MFTQADKKYEVPCKFNCRKHFKISIFYLKADWLYFDHRPVVVNGRSCKLVNQITCTALTISRLFYLFYFTSCQGTLFFSHNIKQDSTKTHGPITVLLTHVKNKQTKNIRYNYNYYQMLAVELKRNSENKDTMNCSEPGSYLAFFLPFQLVD